MTERPDFTHLYKIAEAQAGYFTARQAHEAGYSRERLSDLTARDQFIRVQRGIYRLPHFPASRFEDLFIAHLRTGPNSVISHDSALAVYDLSDVLPSEIHVIMPRTGSRRRDSLRLHTNKIDVDEVTRREGLPVTTPSRTIADVIANGLGRDLVRQAVEDAIRKGLTTRAQLLEQADHREGRVKKIIQEILEEVIQ
ncbi:MAG: type IV toxin-antitoxin system AbiEi family antitoxin domain-containing protein [Anaerolineales bacterium]